MKRYRLHELLRLATLAWVAAACGTESPAGGATADAVADADAGSGLDAADILADAGADAATDAGADSAADSDAAQEIDAAKDSDAGVDGDTADSAGDATSDSAGDATSDATPDIAADTGKDADITGPKGFECLDSKPITIGGADTGYETCANGMVHRRETVACAPYVADPNKTCPIGSGGGCNTDADCAGKGNNPICTSGGGGMIPGCFCQPTCSTDADCGAGSICVCAEGFSKCVPSSCKSDSDCKFGVCGNYVDNPGCDFPAFACQTADDKCAVDADCPPQQKCTVDDATKARVCSPPMCAIGRPFEVEGQWRSAPVEERCDWQGEFADMVPAIPRAALAPALRDQLADWWLAAARMEHASVASFARLVLELMAVGAPADLLARASQAAIDEVRHAELCFALAEHYSGRQLGPAPLAIDGSLRSQSLLQIAAAAAREGCIWETVAALEANVAAGTAEDPLVAALLRRIADDETAHAQLAWDIVHWAIAQGGAPVRAAVVQAMDEAVAQLLQADGGPEVAAGHGVISGLGLVKLRAHAAHQVIAPARAHAGLA